jgi:prepilin-type N-terminal cleavage/methylation domain-containing protein
MTANNQRGYTIVEVLISLVITSILVGVLAIFSISSLINNAINGARIDLQSEAQLALDMIGEDIRLASGADLNNRWQDDNAPGAPTDTLSWESDGDVLVLSTVAENAEREILFEDVSNYISYKNNTIYYIEDGILYKRIVAADIPDNRSNTTCPEAVATVTCRADSAILSNIEELVFTYVDRSGNVVAPENARSVEVLVRLSVDRAGQTIRAEYQTRMVFRNV